MSRKRLVRGVSPLPARLGLTSKKHKAGQLLEILRGLALAQQRQQPRIFYPIREVARHFNVASSMVGRIYGELEAEGILVSIRGSKTLLQGLSSGRHFSVLGFVGMPALMSAFVTLQDYRTFFIRTRRELRARGFAVATVFYDRNEGQSGRLFSRIDKYGFDTVLWHQPDRAAKETVPQLKDSGVQVVGVSDRWFPSIRCHYEVQREPAVVSILRDWSTNAAVKSAVIVRGVEISAAKEELLKALLEEEGLAMNSEAQATSDSMIFWSPLPATKAGELFSRPWLRRCLLFAPLKRWRN